MDELTKKLSEMTGKDKTELLKKLKREAKERRTEEEIKSLLGQAVEADKAKEPEPAINIEAMKREASRKFKPVPEQKVANAQQDINEEWELKRAVKGYFMFGLAVGMIVGLILGLMIP